jgi:hypothetical protein
MLGVVRIRARQATGDRGADDRECRGTMTTTRISPKQKISDNDVAPEARPTNLLI